MPRILHLMILVAVSLSITQGKAATYSLGTPALTEGADAGSDGIALAVNPKTGSWAATNNTSWLHLSVQNQVGAGSTNVIFSYDSNPGSTRTGTLIIAGQTVTITQAGATYVSAFGPATTLANSGLHAPTGVAVDAQGNVYFADNDNNAIKKWTAANNAVTTLVSTGLNYPNSIALDASGNVYIANTYSNTIVKWTPASKTLTTLVSNGLNEPFGVAVDGASNVFIADTLNSAIKVWSPVTRTVTTLVSNGLNHPFGLAVDVSGNVYIADYATNAIKVWVSANNTLITNTAFSDLNSPAGVAVDGSGNIYAVDSGNNAIKEWLAASATELTLVSNGLSYPFGVTVDSSGNLYVADTLNNAIKEFPRAFVDPTAKTEGTSAGTDSLPAILPFTENLHAPFAPTSDQSWLTISSISNGIVNFAFSDSGGTNRTAHLSLLGRSIPVTQEGAINPMTLSNATLPGDGTFRFEFNNDSPGASFTVLTATNLALPLTHWTVSRTASNVDAGLFQFVMPIDSSNSQHFYRLRSP